MFTPLCWKENHLFSVRKLFFFLCNFSLPNTFCLCVCLCGCLRDQKNSLFFFLCFLVPTRIPFRRNPRPPSLIKKKGIQIDNVVRCVCVYYAACQICVIRNLMLARKEGRKKRSIFKLYACVPVCVLYCTSFPFFTKIDRVNLSSPLHFSSFFLNYETWKSSE